MRVLVALLAGLLACEFVAIPCAIIYGHSGPDWPLIPMGALGFLGAIVGWVVAE